MTNTPLYGRREARGAQLWAEADGHKPYQGPTYYGRPAIKQPHYRWLIASYLFVGGVGGASQIIAGMADYFGRDRAVVRAGRYTALLMALLSPLFLILDLHTPKRWYNMLRIFRPTSPMSIGSWTLSFFGAFSGLAAVSQLLEDVAFARLGRGFGKLVSLPAALAGTMMSCYTGSLLSATSVPFWAVVHRLLPPLFGSSAMSTGAAATSLAMTGAGASEEAHHAMEKVALAASAAELALTVASELQWKKTGMETPIQKRPDLSLAYRAGVLGLGIVTPLVIHGIHVATGRRSKVLSHLADFAALSGGMIQRSIFTLGGRDSAERPADYFQFTQPSRP